MTLQFGNAAALATGVSAVLNCQVGSGSGRYLSRRLR